MVSSISLLVTLGLVGQMSSEAETARNSRGTLIGDATVQFRRNSASLSTEAKAKIETFLDRLKSDAATMNLLLVGHCDTKGSESRNSKLAQRRTKTVQSFLTKMGVDREMIFTKGVGPTEPIGRADTREERRRNQRVEFWMVEQQPVATLSWVLNNAQVKSADAAEWSTGEIGDSVFRNYQFRADEASAGEIRFFKQIKILVSPESSVVAYDTRRMVGRPSDRVPDVFVEAGTVIVRKRNSAASTLRIDTAYAQIDMNASHARVRFNAQKKVTTISMIEGSARIRAKGRTVRLASGEGARITERGLPVKFSNLPRPPLWMEKATILLHGDTETEINWHPSSRTTTTIVEFTFPSDPKFERPIQTISLRGNSAVLSHLPPGAYLLRILSRSADGLISAPSSLVKLIALAQPTTMEAVPVLIDKGVVRMPGPGVLSQQAPEGMLLLLGAPGAEDLAGTLSLWASGRYKVSYRLYLSEGEPLFGGGTLNVHVAQPLVKLLKLTPELIGDRSRTPIQIQILGEGDQPITGMKFKIFISTSKISGLEKLRRNVRGEQRGRLQPCECEAPETAGEMIEQGNGYYAYIYERIAGQSFRKDRLRILESYSKMVQEFDVPVGAYVIEAPEEDASGVITTFRAGALLAHKFQPQFRADLDIGYRFHLTGILSFNLTAHTGVFTTDVDLLKAADQTLELTKEATILPLEGRGGFSLLLGKGGMYFGGGGGIAFVFSDAADETQTQHVKPMQNLWSAYFGVFYQTGPGEFTIQADYGPQLLGGTLVDVQLGPSVTMGYRISPRRSQGKKLEFESYDLKDIDVDDVIN